MDEKRALRQEIRRRKREATPEDLARQSAEVARRLLAHPKVAEARCLLLYASLPDEVDTAALLRALRQRGKRVLLPVVQGSERMSLREYRGEAHVKEGAYHIAEPTGQDFTHYELIDVAIVPGMAFDAQGHRLGRGKGYYDRFLPLLGQAYKIGVCYGFQLVERVPTGAFDQPMDEVVTSV